MPTLRPFALAVLATLAAAAPASAATFTVTTPTDGAHGACTVALCSLRDAVVASNAESTPATITLPAGTYDLTTASGGVDLSIAAPMTINGAGAGTTLIEDASGATPDAVVDDSVPAGAVTLSGLTIGPDTGFGPGTDLRSGFSTLTLDRVVLQHGSTSGLRKGFGPLTMTNSIVRGNKDAFQNGGGIETNGTVALDGVSIVDNTNTNAMGGGGMALDASGNNANVGYIRNTTFSGNVATSGPGGGLEFGEFGSGSPTVTLQNDTFTGDKQGPGKQGGELWEFDNREMFIHDTIVGPPAPGGSGCFLNSYQFDPTAVTGTIDASGDVSCGFPTGNGNQKLTDPMLGPLGNNGGFVPTRLPLAGSPAIDAGDDTAVGCAATDARGVARPQGAHCDVGAVEVASPPTVVTGSASAITTTGATLGGTVTPYGLSVTDCHFEVGTTTSYGTIVPCSGATSGAVAAAIAGLAPGTIYHVRLVATTAAGTGTGADETFTTVAAPVVTTTTTTTTTTTPPPFQAPPVTKSPPAIVPAQQSAALACSSAQIVLIDVVARGGKVAIDGAARTELAGRPVSIVFLGTGKPVASTVIGADGTFKATAPLPSSAIRGTNRARYVAIAAEHRSAALKLARRAFLDTVKRSGANVRVSGHVTGAFRTGAKVAISLRVTCGSYRTVGKAKLGRNGTFSAIVPAPTGAASEVAVYRAGTAVLKGGKTFATFTLVRPAA